MKMLCYTDYTYHSFQHFILLMYVHTYVRNYVYAATVYNLKMYLRHMQNNNTIVITYDIFFNMVI